MGERGAPTGVASMDNVERSFAAAVALGFVVLVAGMIMLAIL